jgi:alkylation response protein AidB-like acyl-CoA dehydrogenase
MDFSLTLDQKQIKETCAELATKFAERAEQHDREAASPVEDYRDLRNAGLFGLTVPKELGGLGAGFVGYAIAAEELAQGCASTALAFNMHCAALAILTYKSGLPDSKKRHVAEIAINQGKLISALLSEPGTTGLAYSTRACSTQIRRSGDGYLINGKKAFASMVEASDYACLFAHPQELSNPASAVPVLFPLNSSGLRIERVWDTLGMRATRSDNLILEDCFVPKDAVLGDLLIESVPDFLASNEALVNLPYTAVYLGVGMAALKAAIANVTARRPKGYSQPLAYHPDVRRRVAIMSAQLEAARRLLHYAAWQLDTDAPADQTLSAFLKAKYIVGEAVAAATRSALEMGGAHAIFKGDTIERLFRDGATATIMQPHSDVCLSELSIYELKLDRNQLRPPLIPEN